MPLTLVKTSAFLGLGDRNNDVHAVLLEPKGELDTLRRTEHSVDVTRDQRDRYGRRT